MPFPEQSPMISSTTMQYIRSTSTQGRPTNSLTQSNIMPTYLYPLSFNTLSNTFRYSPTSFAPVRVKSLLRPSTTTCGTESTPLLLCSWISAATSFVAASRVVDPSRATDLSEAEGPLEMNGSASERGMSAARQAARRVEVDDGCSDCVKYCW